MNLVALLSCYFMQICYNSVNTWSAYERISRVKEFLTMDHTSQSAMLMPASYAVLSEEEMTYLDGGADYNFNVGKYTVTFHPEVLVTYA